MAFLRVSRFPFNCPISFSTDDILSRDEESIENIELAKEQTQKSNRAIFSLPLITFLVNVKKQKKKFGNRSIKKIEATGLKLSRYCWQQQDNRKGNNDSVAIKGPIHSSTMRK